MWSFYCLLDKTIFFTFFFKKRPLSSDDDQRVPLEVQCLAVVVYVTCTTTLQLVAVNANSEYLPTHELAFNADELQFLIACVGLDFFADMATSTNLYAAHSGAGTSWYDTNEREMRFFFGIQIMMGIKQQPESLVLPSTVIIGHKIRYSVTPTSVLGLRGIATISCQSACT